MRHSCYHKNETDIWNNSIKNTNLLHPFLWSWSPTVLYIAWTSAFKAKATIVKTLPLIDNSRYKGKIFNNPQIWDFSLLPPTTLNSNYNSAFRSLALQRRAAPIPFCNLLFILSVKEFLRGKFGEEKSAKSNSICSKFLIFNCWSLLIDWDLFLHILPTVFLQKKSK